MQIQGDIGCCLAASCGRAMTALSFDKIHQCFPKEPRDKQDVIAEESYFEN